MTHNLNVSVSRATFGHGDFGHNVTVFESYSESEANKVAAHVRELLRPKTDLERFVELYRSFGIELTPKKTDKGITSITIEAQSDTKITGYYGFVTQIDFDADGKFISQGVWE
jgi:hypothetical protein